MPKLLVVTGFHTEEARFGQKVIQAYFKKYNHPPNFFPYQLFNGVSQNCKEDDETLDEVKILCSQIKPKIILDFHHSLGGSIKKLKPKGSLELSVHTVRPEHAWDRRLTKVLDPLENKGFQIYYFSSSAFAEALLNSSNNAAYIIVEAYLSGNHHRYHNNKWNQGVVQESVELIEALRKSYQR